jgi:hypothetical protein
MTTYTNLLGLALPVTGQLSGSWGNTVNDYITERLDAAIAGALTVSTDVTLTKTTTTALGPTSSQYAIILASGLSSDITVTAPALSKVYLLLNPDPPFAVKICGPGPTTGVTLEPYSAALVAWNGSDFQIIAANNIKYLTGLLSVIRGGTGITSYTIGDILYASNTTLLSKLPAVASGNALITNGVGVAPSYGKIGLTTHVSGTLPVGNGGTGATTLTGVIKGNGTSAFTASNVNLASEVTGTLPVANGGTGVTSLGANIPTFLQTPSSANLAAAVTDETGSGALVFANSPTLGAFNATGNVSLSGGTFVFNDSAADKDARFGGVSDANVIYMDASTNNVGFGTSTPDARVHIVGASGVGSQKGARLTLEATTSTATQSPIFYFRKSTSSGSGLNFYGSTIWLATKDDTTTYTPANIFAGGDNRVATLSGSLYFDAYTNHIWSIQSAESMRLTNARNLKIGSSANRSTTEGTNQLVLFNGTAPVGTLSNGVSIYSSSGEAYVMDASGNATLFSPHDSETNEWIFKSKHTPTGKVLKIDVEKLLRFVNEKFGLDAVHEFVEEN